MKKSSTILLLIATTICFVACSANISIPLDTSKKGSSPNEVKTEPPPIKPKPDGKDDVIRDLKIPASLESALIEMVDEAHLGESKLMSLLKKKEPVPFMLITDLFISKHLRMYNEIRSNLKISEGTPKFDEFRKTLKELESKVTEKSDLHVLKNQMEDSIGIKTYNKDYFTIPNVISQKKVQCYSGTSTFEVFSRDVLGAKSYLDKHQVVLMSKGHVLAGYMEKDKENDWNLVGIETTVKGKAKVSFGKVKNIYKNNALRIYDANLWMILEVLVPYLKDTNKKIDEAKIIAEALEITNAMYDKQIPVAELEKKVVEESKDVSTESSNAGEEVGFGSFGFAEVPAGDIKRAEADDVDPFYSNPSLSPTAVSEEANEKRVVKETTGAKEKIMGTALSWEISISDFLPTVNKLKKKNYKIAASENDGLCLEDLESLQGHWEQIDLFYFIYPTELESGTFRMNTNQPFPATSTECQFYEKSLKCDHVGMEKKNEAATLKYIGYDKKLCWFSVRSASEEATKSDVFNILGIPEISMHYDSFRTYTYSEITVPSIEGVKITNVGTTGNSFFMRHAMYE